MKEDKSLYDIVLEIENFQYYIAFLFHKLYLLVLRPPQIVDGVAYGEGVKFRSCVDRSHGLTTTTESNVLERPPPLCMADIFR